MATLFRAILRAVAEGILNYYQTYDVFKYTYEANPTKFLYQNSDFRTGVDNPIEIAYFHYKRWLETHEDLQIGANYLTNLQLYHVAIAVTSYIKYISSSPSDYDYLKKLQMEYLHVLLKVENPKAFYDAFKCNVTEVDMKQVESFNEKFSEYNKYKFTLVKTGVK